MKPTKLLLIIILSFSCFWGFAQEKLTKEEQARREKNIQAGNPFAKYGNKAPVATLSKGKYLEVHDLDSIVSIGNIRWHVDKKEIVSNIIIDSIDTDRQPTGDATGMWMSPDPLTEEFPSWSPYNMCMSNPIRYVDPDGRETKDIIKFMDNGTVERTKTNDKFDILTNEKGDKNVKINHDKNGSKIGEVQSVGTGKDKTDLMLIKDSKTADKVFEFAASTTNQVVGSEYGLDKFSFSDGFKMNALVLGSGATDGSAGSVIPLGQFSSLDLGNNHLVGNSNWLESNHAHPNGNAQPSGFRQGFNQATGKLKFSIDTTTPPGDRGFMQGAGNRTPNNAYLFSTNAGGYVKYNFTSAKFIGTKK